MADRIQYQETLTASNLTETFTGTDGPIIIEGTFDSGTITQTMPGTTLAIDTFTADDNFYFNGQDVTFTIAGGSGSESVTITWYKNIGATYG